MSAISCPRCNASTTLSPKKIGGGLIGMLIAYAMADRECPKCGIIPLNDFSPETQSSIRRKRVLQMAAVIIGFIVFVSAFVLIAQTMFPNGPR